MGAKMTFVWLITQNVNTDYDTYDSAVVVAGTEEAAKNTHPNEDAEWYSSWAASPDQVKATRIGIADDPTPRVIVASFNAG
jgi:hypothetical protein